MNKPANVTFTLKEGRRTSDPTNPNRFAFSGLTPVTEATKLQPGQIPWTNPRQPNVKSKLARVIKASVFDNRGVFHMLNRGATLVAQDGKLEHEVLTVDFGPSKKRGLVDGGTTAAALFQAISEGFTQRGAREEQQLVRLQVFCGTWTDEEVVDLAEALNTSVQVDSFSIANLDGKFDWIKQALKVQNAAFKVSYFANDDGEVSVDDIVQYLSLFFMDDPSGAYSSKERCLKHFLDNHSDYKKFAPVLLDIIKLSEYIPFKSKTLYNASGNHLKFGKLSIIQDSTKGSSYALLVLGETIEYAPHKAWVFPILASLRPALDVSGNQFKWKSNPFKLFDRLAPELIKKVNRSYTSLQTFNAVGKNPDLYDVLMEKVKVEI